MFSDSTSVWHCPKYHLKLQDTASVVDEWVWVIDGMILTGKTEVLGEKHYRASVVDEWVWGIDGMWLTGETEVLVEKHYTASVVDEWMGMEHWWNDTDRGNWSIRRDTSVSATFSTTDATWTDLVLNPILCGGSPASDLLSHGRVLKSSIDLNYIYI